MNQREREAQEKWIKFQMAEAQWLDGIVRPMLPSFLVKSVEYLAHSPRLAYFGRLLHFLVDYFVIGKMLGIKITRNRDMRMVSGKGWRPGHGQQRLDQVRTTVLKRGKEIAKQAFPVGIIMS
jgi:hypothetical protein